MTFDALSKELNFLKQGSGKNVAEFGVCFLQQVQILQSEYPRRIQQEHVEEMKQDHFYEGLNPQILMKVSLNAKEGTTEKGGWTPQKPVVAQLASLDDAPRA